MPVCFSPAGGDYIKLTASFNLHFERRSLKYRPLLIKIHLIGQQALIPVGLPMAAKKVWEFITKENLHINQ